MLSSGSGFGFVSATNVGTKNVCEKLGKTISVKCYFSNFMESGTRSVLLMRVRTHIANADLFY
jgi:hypothetical protein